MPSYDASTKIISGRKVETRLYEDISPEAVLLAAMEPKVRAEVRGIVMVSRPLPAHWRKRLAHVGE